MSHDRLDYIVFISIKNNSLKKVDYEQIIYNFREKKYKKDNI